MGIDYKVVSTNPAFYSENDPNQFLKYAWRNIQWPAIFEILDFTITQTDVDSTINYWTAEDVKEMRDSIYAFCHKSWWIPDDYDLRKSIDDLHDNALKLLEFFDYYVAHDACIHAC